VSLAYISPPPLNLYRVHQATGCQVLDGLLRQDKPVYCATADPSCHLCLLLRTGTIPKIEGSMGTFSYLHHTLENAMKPQSMGLLNQGVRVILTAEVTLGVAQQYSKYEGFVAAKDGHNVAVRNIGTNNARYAVSCTFCAADAELIIGQVYDDKAIFVKEIVLYSPVKEERTPTPPTPDEATPHRPWGKLFTGGFGGTRKDGQPGW
jgi:hypothetical protein